MGEQEIKALQEKLMLQQKELDLLVAIDNIRDSDSAPGAMLSSIADLLVDLMEVQLCLVFLLDRDSGDAEMAALCDHAGLYTSASQQALGVLAQQAVNMKEIAVWRSGEGLAEVTRGLLPEDTSIMAVPVYLTIEQKLGAILLFRTTAPFIEKDVKLMVIAENQVDSAIIQGYSAEKLNSRQRELDTIFRLDHIRDQGLPINEMLNAVAGELTKTIEAEIGFIMLYDLSGKKLETRACTCVTLTSLNYFDEINHKADDALEQGDLICQNYPSGDLKSVMCLPLILNEQIIGVIGVVNRFGPYGFTKSDQRMLKAIGSQIDTAIYERNEIRILRRVLGRSVDPRVMERLLANLDMDFLKGEQVELSILYADIRGSTALAEATPPGILVEFIRDYLTRMTEVVLKYEGTIDKFVGDEVMALFGVPIPQEDHALLAVRVGLEMQAQYAKVQEVWEARGLRKTSIGVGIATGEAIAGEMGSAQRSNYTVIGRPANLGSRICEVAAGGQVLISQRTYDLVCDRIEAEPVHGNQFKGVAGDVTVYHVLRVLD
jgi:adenylate cyclase